MRTLGGGHSSVVSQGTSSRFPVDRQGAGQLWGGQNYLEAVREYNEDAFLRPDSGT